MMSGRRNGRRAGRKMYEENEDGRMKAIGFDNEKYLEIQSRHILQRIGQFDNKLYLEMGGKLFDDFHASRVLPGFLPDSKMKMLLQLSEQVEIIIVINAGDIEKSKRRLHQERTEGLYR